jgi:hypothetical protein
MGFFMYSMSTYCMAGYGCPGRRLLIDRSQAAWNHKLGEKANVGHILAKYAKSLSKVLKCGKDNSTWE